MEIKMNKLVLTLTFGVLASSAFANPGHGVKSHLDGHAKIDGEAKSRARKYAVRHDGSTLHQDKDQAKANAKKYGKKLESKKGGSISNPEAKGDAVAAAAAAESFV